MKKSYQVVDHKELNQNKVDELLQEHASFEVVNVPFYHQVDAVTIVENRCEALGMKCRVYFKGRTVIGSVMAVIPPLTPIGVATLAASGVHNVATYDPDYEIRKEFGTGIVVTYKK